MSNIADKEIRDHDNQDSSVNSVKGSSNSIKLVWYRRLWNFIVSLF